MEQQTTVRHFISVLIIGALSRSCHGANCWYPGVPANGALSPAPNSGGTYLPGSVVRFTCRSGYTLVGSSQVFCQLSGSWFGSQPCCRRDECEPPAAPRNGRVHFTQLSVGSKVNYTCYPGYTIIGVSSATCLGSQRWSNVTPYCKQCPVNTYKRTEQSCAPCPIHSDTRGRTGAMKAGCVCEKGYQAGTLGNCIDHNECLTNGGNGPCSDICTNSEGGHRCGCSIPGYKLGSDSKTCVQEKFCPPGQYPKHGGAVCVHNRTKNGVYCALMCNKGQEFPSSINDYEVCDATTGWRWTYNIMGTESIAPCIDVFFPGLTMEFERHYFDGSCPQLTAQQKQKAKEGHREANKDNKGWPFRVPLNQLTIQCGS